MRVLRTLLKFVLINTVLLAFVVAGGHLVSWLIA